MKNFMKGRYGIDELYKFLFVISFILLLINIIFHVTILYIIILVLYSIMIYRALSKNLYQRVKENNIYLNIKRKILNLFRKKEYIYKKCHKCKTVMRLKTPSKRGIKHVKCPNCSKRNTYLVLKKYN